MLEAALNEEPRAGADRKLTSNEEALLVATACSSPPEGRARWTLELLAGAMVKLTTDDSLSRETVRRRLAENHLKPWQKDMWCIPKVDAEYVARMEDVLDLYAEQPDPRSDGVPQRQGPITMEIFPLFLGCALILIGVMWLILRSLGTKVVLAAAVGYWLGSRERSASGCEIELSHIPFHGAPRFGPRCARQTLESHRQM